MQWQIPAPTDEETWDGSPACIAVWDGPSRRLEYLSVAEFVCYPSNKRFRCAEVLCDTGGIFGGHTGMTALVIEPDEFRTQMTARGLDFYFDKPGERQIVPGAMAASLQPSAASSCSQCGAVMETAHNGAPDRDQGCVLLWTQDSPSMRLVSLREWVAECWVHPDSREWHIQGMTFAGCREIKHPPRTSLISLLVDPAEFERQAHRHYPKAIRKRRRSTFPPDYKSRREAPSVGVESMREVWRVGTKPCWSARGAGGTRRAR